ncbi:LPS translocon maturation chaperone LptM [Pseudoxanthomonas yeongjuensis]|uniref:LPS translocon maturation chaperone LptM n=1 Tax=Pseudoxanthomonas yeongjuensis TaxID=377616 RepID=UPI0013918BCE|nr:lipoprotein [Pseudoxanthomonas yeongjuensis]
MNKSMRITLSGIVLALLAGCGAKGPLILPEKAVPIEVPTETTPEATPESVPSVDATETDTTPTEPQTGDAVETPVPPAKDD